MIFTHPLPRLVWLLTFQRNKERETKELALTGQSFISQKLLAFLQETLSPQWLPESSSDDRVDSPDCLLVSGARRSRCLTHLSKCMIKGLKTLQKCTIVFEEHAVTEESTCVWVYVLSSHLSVAPWQKLFLYLYKVVFSCDECLKIEMDMVTRFLLFQRSR